MATAKKPTKQSPKATQKAPKPDWPALEVEYVNSTITYEDLAEKYGIKPGTVRARAHRGRWAEKRSNAQRSVTEGATENLVRTRTKELTALDHNALKITKAAQRLMAKAIGKMDAGEHPGFELADLRAIAYINNHTHKTGRLALGATTENTGFSAPDGGPVETKTEVSVEQFAEIARKVADAV